MILSRTIGETSVGYQDHDHVVQRDRNNSTYIKYVDWPGVRTWNHFWQKFMNIIPPWFSVRAFLILVTWPFDQRQKERKKEITYCLFPGRIVTWAWSLAKGQYMVSWLLTGAPEQRYWQNRETANVGLDSSVGRAPARQSGGRRFKSRSSQFSLFIQIYLKSVPSQFPLWFITWNK